MVVKLNPQRPPSEQIEKILAPVSWSMLSEPSWQELCTSKLSPGNSALLQSISEHRTWRYSSLGWLSRNMYICTHSIAMRPDDHRAANHQWYMQIWRSVSLSVLRNFPPLIYRESRQISKCSLGVLTPEAQDAVLCSV